MYVIYLIILICNYNHVQMIILVLINQKYASISFVSHDIATKLDIIKYGKQQAVFFVRYHQFRNWIHNFHALGTYTSTDIRKFPTVGQLT